MVIGINELSYGLWLYFKHWIYFIFRLFIDIYFAFIMHFRETDWFFFLILMK